ncbi:hypothetical protein G7Z17_g9273 [Cylindrodendrum hubeiense]|uniref:Uncharacterized protein n=1 Tax=Cylindrodendrum hubeiense TaxID=595255 RepID=A0A9P5H9K0_9HYPO|nr:hypothetical protein G7Z17_g9273 [Cylindrodendrum hubeiense]
MDTGPNTNMAHITPKLHETATGDDTQKLPGSYPSEETSTRFDSPKGDVSQVHGLEHNTLHKHIDSRGLNEGQNTTPGHSYTDSGVGLINAHDFAPDYQPSEAKLDNQRAAFDTQRATISHDQDRPLEQEHELPTRIGAAGTTNLASHQVENHSLDASEEHPYWGDLPQGEGVYNTVTGHGSREGEAQPQGDLHQGAGVYNTVTGHGSREDEAQRHQGDLHQGTGVYNTVTGHGSREDEAQRHREIHNRESGVDEATITSPPATSDPLSASDLQPSSLSTNRTRTPADTQTHGEHESSRSKESMVGVGATAATAAAAVAWAASSGTGNSRQEDESRKNVGNLNESKTTQDAKHIRFLDNSKFEKSEDAVEKQAYDKKPHSGKESHSNGIFHRSHEDKQHPKPMSDKSLKNHANAEDSTPAKHDLVTGMYRHDHTERAPEPGLKDRIVRDQDQYRQGNAGPNQAINNSTTRNDGFENVGHADRDHSAAPAFALAGAGGVAAYAASRGREHDEQEKDRVPGGYQYQPAEQGTIRDQFLSNEQGDNGHRVPTTSASPGVRTCDSAPLPPASNLGSDDFNHTAGLGAGAGESQGLERQTAKFRENFANNHSPHGLKPAAETVPVAAPRTKVSNTSNEGMLDTFDRSGAHGAGDLGSSEGVKTEPGLTESANKGDYNLLSSGTPSGINIDHHESSQS